MAQVNLIDIDDLEDPDPKVHPGEVDGRPLMSAAELKEAIYAMNAEQRGQLAEEMGAQEDFPAV